MNLSPINFESALIDRSSFVKKEFCSPLQQFSILFTPTKNKPIPELTTESWIFSVDKNATKKQHQNYIPFVPDVQQFQIKKRSQSVGTKEEQKGSNDTYLKELLTQQNHELKLKLENIQQKYKNNLKSQIIKDNKLYCLETDNKEFTKENSYLKASTIYMEQKFEQYIHENQELKKQLENSVSKSLLKSFFKQFKKDEISIKTKGQIIDVFSALLNSQN